MKRTIATIFAIAIIGALGIYGKGHSATTSGSTNPQPTITTPSNTAQASSMHANNSSAMMNSSNLSDGNYTGDTEDTPYGPVQVAIVVSGGKITDVNFLQLPYDRGYSQQVSAYASPLLKQETIGKQNAQIDFVSGATSTSEGYEQSLQSALNQA